jgi:DNA-binding transcriptional MerR regulator
MIDQDKTEQAYWSKEVADLLKVAGSTMRKWCLALEDKGYKFTRGANNSRVFYDRDILLLRRLKSLVQENKMALDTSVKLVLSTFEEDRRTKAVHEENAVTQDVTVSNDNDHEHVLLTKVLEKLERMEEFNRTLVSRLEQRDKYIDEQLHKRNEDITKALREMIETKKLIASSQEEKKEENKGFFARLFGK